MTRALSPWFLLAAACTGAGDPPPVPPEVDARLVINEVMAANGLTLLADDGTAPDWIEIYNPTDQEVPLRGYGLTDDLGDLGRASIGSGAVVPAGGHLVVWLDGRSDLGGDHVDLDLAREGGDLGLSRPDGSLIDALVLGRQEVDFSAAREPDGSVDWVIEWHPSPGQANPDGDGSPATPGGEPEPVPEAGDLSARILGYEVIPEIELLVSAEAAASLEAQPRTYVQATLVYDGREYGPVGLRLKGQKSFLPFSEKASLRVNVDEFAPEARFFGLDDLTLNNMSTDQSMLRERLAYLVAREAGVTASRANHGLVRVNGEVYGLFANVETVKGEMMERWYDDPAGSLFEGVKADFVAGGEWELESGPDDRRLIEGAIAALANPDAGAAIARAGDYLRMPQFLRYWAMCAVIGQFDSLPTFDDDYFIYADPATDRLWFTPWGMDESMSSSNHDILETRSVLAAACKATPGCFDQFVGEVWDVLALVEELDLEAERARVAAEIAPLVALDTRRPYTDAAVAQGQNNVRWFILERRDKLATMIPPAGE